ncbi:hypothetical protein GF1_31280 [Desulfolithobacter dissulfuricans]|uniref:Uncharacterized protein n=1 Tax=Desulfolithobacter dissulfuricans TaxID=2795293 RepID=A0A915XL11_9BACT|nr:hypothetical protein GF1_31280 [Desulfolithobacter dissulfuricans]
MFLIKICLLLFLFVPVILQAQDGETLEEPGDPGRGQTITSPSGHLAGEAAR